MANASYIQDSFAGGEKSQLAQGRITEREYRTWMNVCLNGHPVEGGGWTRRSGTMYAGHTRGGAAGRVYRFDFAAATPYTMEFTNGFIRFRQGLHIATTNDAQSVVAISAANPAVVQTGAASGWANGNTVMLSGAQPLTQNRQFVITVVDPTHFSLADALTGATIDGSTLGALPAGATVSRVQEVATPYVGGSWQALRGVQAELTATLLVPGVPPQLLTAVPVNGGDAQFSLAGITFLDGPYLDPFTNGVQAAPSGLSGNITLTLGFPAWSATQAYQKGQFVTSSSVNYQSLIDNNVNNTPVSSPSAWVAVSAGVAINGGKGFLGTDVGRPVRLFSEPPLWVAATTYAVGSIVSYNPTGQPGAATYWISLLGSNTGNIPGQDITHWQLTPANAAIWTWGKITSLGTQISQTLAGSVNIGTMTGGGGVNSAFDNNINEDDAHSAELTTSISYNANTPPTPLSLDCYVGKNYTGAGAQKIAQVTVFPSTNIGLAPVLFSGPVASIGSVISQSLTINLRAKQTAPASPSDGTLLGTSGNVTGLALLNAVTIASSDQVTAWNYVWVEYVANATVGEQIAQIVNLVTATLYAIAAEVQFFSPPGSGGGNVINVEILGPPLLYTTPCISWRLGAYSNTTGWPTCGCYHEGRLWLAGAIDNRFDASVSNGLAGTTLNFAPTDQNGVVGAANGITGVVNSDTVNPIFWLQPDLQGIIMGSQGGEWLISGAVAGAISPTNIQAPRVTKIGCANVEPRKTDHTTVFVQRYARKVMEYFTDVYSGKFAAPNLAKDTLHITKPGVAELAWQQAVIPIIWMRGNDGSWFGSTYKRETLATAVGPTINGWHRHQLGSGRSVQSIATGPSVGGSLDALTMVTLDPATGIYHVEVLTDAADEGNTLLQATYVDDAVNPTSTSTSNATPAPYGGLTLNGLWHLNGKTVTAWLGGLDCGDYTVVNGSITVPYGDGISAGTGAGLFTAPFAAALPLSQMLVGFTFTSQGQIVRPALPAESGARNGPAVGKVRRNHKIAAQFEGTGVGLTVGTTFAKMDPVKFRQLNGTPYLVNQLFTGVYKETLTDNASLDGMICWQQVRPLPANLANIGGFIETSDE